MVTNPATRDWTVTASLFATLNEMYGNRTICGIGRGDSAVRVDQRHAGEARRAARVRSRSSAAWPTARRSSTRARRCGFPWNPDSRLRDLGRRLRPEGAGADRRGRRRLHPPARRPGHHRVAHRRRAQGGRRRPAATPTRSRSASPRPRTSPTDRVGRPTRRDQCRWFGGHGRQPRRRHRRRYGGDGAAVPTALTDYIAGREGYDYNEHGRAGNTHTAFVPDEIVDRFCLIGPPEAQVARLKELADLGVDQFALYLQHDAKDATLRGVRRARDPVRGRAGFGEDLVEAHVVAGVAEDVAQPGDDLVEQRGVGDQRRGDLQRAVAAVVGAGDEAGFAQALGQEAAQQVVALGLVEAGVVVVGDELDRPEEAAAADVADDRQRRAARAGATRGGPRGCGRSPARRRARRSRCSPARSTRRPGGRRT